MSQEIFLPGASACCDMQRENGKKHGKKHVLTKRPNLQVSDFIAAGVVDLAVSADSKCAAGQASNSSKSLAFAFSDRYLRDARLCTDHLHD